MIIELFGLSGSGKSTIARSLESSGKAERIRIASRGELLWRSAFYVLRHPFLSLAQLNYLVCYAGSSRLFYTKFMNLFLHHAAKYQKARSKRGAVVIDQGHLQNLLSLFERPLSRDELIHYLTFLSNPDQIWVCEASDDERERRLRARGQDGRAGENPAVREEHAHAARENFATSLDILSADSSLSVRIIPADQDIDALVI